MNQSQQEGAPLPEMKKFAALTRVTIGINPFANAQAKSGRVRNQKNAEAIAGDDKKIDNTAVVAASKLASANSLGDNQGGSGER